jgi:oxygen-independent coproporphyrinogen-3 oxidase
MSGIYLHIPFCRQACTYCDFHFSTFLQTVDKLIESLQNEITVRKDYLSGETISTIYFGGGTPSLLEVEKIEELLGKIRKEFRVTHDAEITLEANPDDLTAIKSKALFKAGINRLSIGIQSFSDDDLKFMNRAHNSQQAFEAIKNVREAGFENISIYLIYGIQNQSPAQWERNLQIAFEMQIEHLSCYALTVESRTVLADMIKKKKIAPLDEEKALSDFEWLMDRAEAAGYEHYEISNFARDKKYSKHNTAYWQKQKYLGLGPSAHSFDLESRQWNVSNNQLYIRSLEENKLNFEREELTETNKFNEYVLTSLRTMWGTDLKLVEKEFGKTKRSFLETQFEVLEKGGFVERKQTTFILTRKGKFFADKIAGDLFE